MALVRDVHTRSLLSRVHVIATLAAAFPTKLAGSRSLARKWQQDASKSALNLAPNLWVSTCLLRLS